MISTGLGRWLVAAAAAGLLSSPGRVAALTVDQASESGSVLGTLGQPDNAQTFTAGIAGRLARVEVEIQLNNTQAENLLFDVRPAPGGVPSNNDADALATGLVQRSDLVLGVRTWIGFDVTSAAIDQVPGQTYAIVLRVPTTTDPAQYFWLDDLSNPYPGGQRWGRGGGGLGTDWNGSFAAFATTDMNFRTIVPEPSSWVLLLTGFIASGAASASRLLATPAGTPTGVDAGKARS